MRTVVFGCPACGRGVEVEPGGTAACRACGAAASLPPAEGDIARCVACGNPELYRHRDFNQKLGLLVIGLGAALCFVWPYWPLGIAALVDLALWRTLPDVAICYRCKAHHRGFAGIAGLPAFDLERHEHYRFRRAREEGRLPPRTQ